MKTFMPKETKFMIPGSVGALEAISKATEMEHARGIGVFCHPNPQQGGKLDNKVVTTACKAFNHQGLHSIRFNFRGVGQSEGTYGNVDGEINDLKSVLEWVKHLFPEMPIYFGGISFGSYVATKLTFESSKIYNIKQLFSVAPTVDRRDYIPFKSMSCPWVIIQGEDDEVVPSQAVYQWYASLMENIENSQRPKLIKIPKAGHFFNGQLSVLRRAIEDNLI